MFWTIQAWFTSFLYMINRLYISFSLKDFKPELKYTVLEAWPEADSKLKQISLILQTNKKEWYYKNLKPYEMLPFWY